jgi:glucokinase
VALHVTDEACRLLGRALASVSCMLDPEAFVIGGGMSRAGEPLLAGIRKHYRACAFHACRETEFRLAELSNDAGLFGAACLLLGCEPVRVR